MLTGKKIKMHRIPNFNLSIGALGGALCWMLGWVLGIVMLLMMVPPVFGQQDSRKNLIISAIANEQTHELAKEVVRVAYEKMGMDVKFMDLPARRGLEWANSGKTDGDLARIDGTDKKFTNLIKILTPVTQFKGVVFTKNIEQNIRSWEDLKGLSVGIIGGIRYSDIGTKGLDRVIAKDMVQLFILLSKERIDVAVAVLDAGKIEINRHHREAKLHVIGQPLFSASLFHFVHKKNRDLVPLLGSVLQEMEESGEISKILEQTMNKALSQ
jgi:polar amino acid transport system substrate-binding protein